MNSGLPIPIVPAEVVESTILVNCSPTDAIERVKAAFVAAAYTKILIVDEEAGKLSFRSRMRWFEEPCDSFVLVEPSSDGNSIISIRVTGSAIDCRPKSHRLLNKVIQLIAQNSRTQKTAQPPNRIRVPLWFSGLIPLLVLFALIVNSGLSKPSVEVVEYLQADNYASALERIAQTQDDDLYNKVEALLGAGRTKDAIQILDSKKDPEWVAFAKARQGDIAVAEKLLTPEVCADPTMDKGVLYLTRATKSGWRKN